MIPPPISGELFDRISQSLGPEATGLLDKGFYRESLQWHQTIFVVRPWKALIDLNDFGYIGPTYRVLNSRFELQYEAYSPEGLYGIQEEDKRLLWTARNGEPFFLMFPTKDLDTKEIVLICQNELHPADKRRILDRAVAYVNLHTRGPEEHEILLRAGSLGQKGYLQILYLPGDPVNVKTRNDFFVSIDENEFSIRDEVEVTTLPLTWVESWHPTKSGWYTLRHAYANLYTYKYCRVTNDDFVTEECYPFPFPGSKRQIHRIIPCRTLTGTDELKEYPNGEVVISTLPVEMTNISGIGVHRILFHRDGIFYLDPSSNKKSVASPTTNLLGIGIPQLAVDTSNWIHLETTLSYYTTLNLSDKDAWTNNYTDRDNLLIEDKDEFDLVILAINCNIQDTDTLLVTTQIELILTSNIQQLLDLPFELTTSWEDIDKFQAG